jgi:hypothetical protein
MGAPQCGISGAFGGGGVSGTTVAEIGSKTR